jgi:hypothetical protein
MAGPLARDARWLCGLRLAVPGDELTVADDQMDVAWVRDPARDRVEGRLAKDHARDVLHLGEPCGIGR